MSTIEKDLPSIISNSQEVTLHLSQSIFLVSIGVNDYTTNYLINFKGTWTGYTPEAFGDFLLNEFFIRMQRLYHLGARKFVVNAAYPVGWAPYYVANGTRAKEINQQIQYFTTRVPREARRAAVEVCRFFVHCFTDVRRPCCPADGNATSFCEPNMAVCEDRKKYMFLDGGHTTESANGILAQECFSGTLCKPNIIELVKAP
ncbi:GDSL esterase/lipase family [Quillaja saponaria]|uniref:GDSL esterase/lipase family n=1 Tax=Quillaja saponaria TaxID=32244 RepID=A0AAD7PG96_QUISA|nr:GDSL esterase/lipase family [Quillaja saponaria]